MLFFHSVFFLQGEMFFLLQFRERGNGNLICIMPGIFMRFEPVWLIGLLPGRDSCARDGFLKLPGLRFHDERNRDNRRGERGSRPGGVTLYPEAGRDALPRRWGVSHLLFFRSICAFFERGQPNIRTIVWFNKCSAVCMGGYSALLCPFNSICKFSSISYKFFYNGSARSSLQEYYNKVGIYLHSEA